MFVRILCLLLTLTLIGCNRQEADWNEAQQKDTIAAYQAFLESYPDSPPAEQAQARIETLRAEQAWASAQEQDTIEAYSEFLKAHPNATPSDEAGARLQALQRASRWQELASSDNVEALRSFAETYAGSAEADLALARADEMAAQAAAAAEAEAERAAREREAQPQRDDQRDNEAGSLTEQGTHRVQLAVLRGADRASSGITQLQQKRSAELGDVKLESQQTNGLYRLVTQPMTYERATALCQTLKQQGQDCLVRTR